MTAWSKTPTRAEGGRCGADCGRYPVKTAHTMGRLRTPGDFCSLAGSGRARSLSGVDAKQEIRERIWELLQRQGAARFPGARGRIPNFRGAERAADQLAELPEWGAAHVVKANPDS